MRYILLLVLTTLITSCGRKTALDKEIPLKEVDKVIAVLPFAVFNGARVMPKEKSVEKLREEDRREGITMQRDLYRYFLRKMKVLGYPQEFIQDVNDTNHILRSFGIKHTDLVKMRKGELAEMLQVDGVVSGIVDQLAPASSLVVGLVNGNVRPTRVRARFTYHNRDGHLIWKVDRKGSGADDELAYGLSKKIMRKIPEKFPFRRI